MTLFKNIFLIFSSCLIFSGCAAGIKGRADLPQRIANSNSPYSNQISNTLDDSKIAELAYLNAREANQPGKMRAHRDDYIYAMLSAYELALQDYSRKLSIEGRGGSFAQKLAVLGLSTAGAISTVSQTQAILSSVSGAITGLGQGYNEQLLIGNTVPVLLNNMVTAQLLAREAIFARMKLNTLAYPLSAAKFDITGIGRTATIEVALNEAAGSSLSARRDALEKVENVRTVPFTSNAQTQKLIAWFSVADDAILRGRVGAAKAFLARRGIKESVSVFIASADKYGALYPVFIRELAIK